MSQFIQEVADWVKKQYGDQIQAVTVIFANKRAGLFFKKALADGLKKPIWQPEILSLEDFIHKQSRYTKISSIAAVYKLYECYQSLRSGAERFDQFFFWGEMILRDFEEIDQYLVAPDKLFTFIENQKELDEAFFFLEAEDREIITSFWNTFLPDATPNQQAFLQTWKILKPLHAAFTKKLRSEGVGYNGLIYRDFLEELPQQVNGPVVFAGFNALTFAEERIVKHWVKNFGAKIFWDLDAHYVEDPYQEAGKFFRQYLKDPVLGRTFPDDIPKKIDQGNLEINLTGVSLEIGQTKAMGEKLFGLISAGKLEPERTAIILPKEHLLFPVLHALPASIRKVNVTMGYPLRETSVYGLLESLIDLQIQKRIDLLSGVSFYTRPVLDILSHHMIKGYDTSFIDEWIKEIQDNNIIRLYLEEFVSTKTLWKAIFQDAVHPLEYLVEVLQLLKNMPDSMSRMDHAVLVQFIVELQDLQELLAEQELGFPFIQKLLRKWSRSVRLPFSGEPLEGIQVMGVLETRNLDFDHVFILGLNEDSWPTVSRKGSFIPHNIRKAFDLPVYEHQDAIYAYLFYRLLHGATRIDAYYNTVAEFNINGEVSRYIRQLKHETSLPIKEQLLTHALSGQLPVPITIEKDENILHKLVQFTTSYVGKGASKFSPTSLEYYLTCRLKFYFRYVLRLYEPKEVQDEMDAMIFGTLLHKTMELLYRDFVNKEKRDIVSPADFFYLRSGVPGMLNQACLTHFKVKNSKKFKLEGKNAIAAAVVEQMAYRILSLDEQYAPFKLLAIEADKPQGYGWVHKFEVAERKYAVRIGGQIDRIDMKQHKIRIIDYKTGADNKYFDPDTIIDRESKTRNKAAFQTLYYSLLYHKKEMDNGMAIEPGIFNTREMFKDSFDWRIFEKKSHSGSTPVTDAREYFRWFEGVLDELLREVYDPNVPFDQTNDLRKCQYCEFKDICGR